jgi:NADPH:quinone reductase-like Zn-dependent oxidoreductase
MSTSNPEPADDTPTMRALCLREQGGPAGLAQAQLPVPVPGTGDVLLRVHGASYTPGELDWPSTWVDRSGHDRRPVVPGHEVSGVVVALGWGTSGLAVGDEVFGLTDWYRDGAMAEYMTVEARSLAPKPARLEHDAAATIPMPGLTAWQGLFSHGRLKAGETVLVLGAAGGVGTLAVQLARHAGARVLGLGRARDAEVIVRAGADVILSADGDLGSERVGLIFDTIGGATLERAWDVLEDGGRVVSIAEPLAPARLAEHHASGGYFVVEPDREGLRELAARIDAGTLNPTVGITCTLDDGREKIIAKESGGFPGKLALTVA